MNRTDRDGLFYALNFMFQSLNLSFTPLQAKYFAILMLQATAKHDRAYIIKGNA